MRLQLYAMKVGDSPQGPLVKLGEPWVQVPARFTVVIRYGPEGLSTDGLDLDQLHEATLEVEMARGVPRARSIGLQPSADSTLSAAEIRIPLVDWVEKACGFVAVVTDPPVSFWQHEGDLFSAVFEEGRRAAVRVSRRRTLDDDFLRAVADVFLGSGRDVDAVREAFPSSRSQTFRYLKLARERGLLDEENE